MTVLTPSIFYFHHQTVLRLAYLNCVKHFSFPRLLFTTLLLSLHLFGVLFISFGRLMDEIFFRGYKDVDLSDPVFIISNPRCGTTFLHRLLCLDKDRYTFTLLYHTLLPSVFYIKMIQKIASLDSKMGGFLHRVFKGLSDLIFGGWKDVHPMGFDRSEEDEALFTIAAYSPALILLSPWAAKLSYLDVLDNSDPIIQAKIKEFYITSLKRIVYACSPEKTLLIKNVFSTGRLNFILDCFPNAKIIYPVRHPYKAVPSVVSMFAGPWKVHSQDIKDDSEESRDFAQIAIKYYSYINEQRVVINPQNLLIIKYDNIIKNPTAIAQKIYKHFSFEITKKFSDELDQYVSESKKYKSKHTYSLAQYGMSKSMINDQLGAVMDEFGFDRNLEA